MTRPRRPPPRSVTRSRTRAPSRRSTRTSTPWCVTCCPTRPTPVRCPPTCPSASRRALLDAAPPARGPRPARARERGRRPRRARTVAPGTRRRHGAHDAVARRTAQADLPRRRGRCGCGRRRRGGLGPAPDEATERCGGRRRHLQLGASASPSSGPSSAPSGAQSSPPATRSGLHIQLSTTAYSPGKLAAQARTLLDHPGQPIGDLAAESPAVGPIATPTGLESCLRAIGAGDGADTAPGAVSADLATFDGHPAVVVVVTRAGVSTAWAVERSCTTGAPGVLEGPTPVP